MLSNEQKLSLLVSLLLNTNQTEVPDLKKEQTSDLVDNIIGKMCVVRTYTAGVYVGVIDKLQGKECLLKDARIIYSWTGAKTTLDIANNGVSGGSFSSISDIIYLLETISIIPMSKNSIDIFAKMPKTEYKF